MRGPLASSIIAWLTLQLVGCIGIGPVSIAGDRTSYNDVLIDTSNQQLMKNIVRVSKQEQPAFVDVTEVNATTGISTSPSGMVANIGALAGYIGSAGSGFTYTENPVIKYVPVSGYAQIVQFGLPFAASQVVNLLNTQWGLATVLEFVTNTITPSFIDNYRAVDIIIALDKIGTLSFNYGSRDNEIVINFNGSGSLRLANVRQVDRNDTSLDCRARAGLESRAGALWRELQAIFRQGSSNYIVLTSNKPSTITGYAIQTRSALGALKLADGSEFMITSPEIAASIRAANGQAACFTQDFYYAMSDVTPADPVEITRMWAETADNILDGRSPSRSRDTAYYLGHKRRFFIIEKSLHRPANSYVSTYHKGYWYSIDDDDKITKSNFSFLNELLILQAIPDPDKLSKTVIPVGGGVALTAR